jgi:hypothetical protein
MIEQSTRRLGQIVKLSREEVEEDVNWDADDERDGEGISLSLLKVSFALFLPVFMSLCLYVCPSPYMLIMILLLIVCCGRIRLRTIEQRMPSGQDVHFIPLVIEWCSRCIYVLNCQREFQSKQQQAASGASHASIWTPLNGSDQPSK